MDGLVFKALMALGLHTPGAPLTASVILMITSVSLAVIAAISFVTQRLRGRGLDDFGLARVKLPSLRSCAWILVGSLILQAAMTFVLEPVVSRLLDAPLTLPEVPSLSALLAGIAVSFVGGGLREELFFRGYLISRVDELLSPARGSLMVAAVFQIFVFATAHLYQGYAGVVLTGLSSIVFTIIYLRTGSLWKAILCHSLYDVWGFVAIYLGLSATA